MVRAKTRGKAGDSGGWSRAIDQGGIPFYDRWSIDLGSVAAVSALASPTPVPSKAPF
jgi:hypothetical protein